MKKKKIDKQEHIELIAERLLNRYGSNILRDKERRIEQEKRFAKEKGWSKNKLKENLAMLNKIFEIIEDQKITCHKCGYEWITRSRRLFVTCPSCLAKVKNKKGEMKGDEILEWK